MRVLIAHNAYQNRGGEDSVAGAELDMLRSHGHAVETFQRHNDELKTMTQWEAAISTVWSRKSAAALTAVIERFRPDIVHFHNTFPLISPSAYWAAHAAGLPVVQTLHNFRLHCPQAMYLRDGRICEDCLGRLPWKSVLHACYRNSAAQSAVLSSMLTWHRILGTYRNKITRYIALNEFCRRKFIEGGLPADRIAVKPNFVDFDAAPPSPRAGLLFAGRLSAEKGLRTLLEAMALLPGMQLRVAGEGPDAAILDDATGVTRLGRLTAEDTRREMNTATALIVPSICYETFGLVVIEAFACGTPVIASRIGALAGLIKDGVTGLLFEPGNAADLAGKIKWLLAHPAEAAQMGRNARLEYERSYTAERNHNLLISIYQDAINARHANN